MSIKIAALKSGEQIISDIQEVYIPQKDDQDKLVAYKLSEAYAVNIFLDEYDEHGQDRNYTMNFSPWFPLSKDKDYFIPLDWVITLYEPADQVKQSYLENKNGRNDRYDGRDGRGGGDSDSDQNDSLERSDVSDSESSGDSSD